MSGSAPASTNVCRISRWTGSFVPVVSLPSEKLPAPPSPNCTFVRGSSTPSFQNVSTAATRSSMAAPRSSTTGFRPALASVSAAKMPQGPKPAITGRLAPSGSLSFSGKATGSTVTATAFTCALLASANSSSGSNSLSSTSTLNTRYTSGFSLASRDSFAMRIFRRLPDGRRSRRPVRFSRSCSSSCCVRPFASCAFILISWILTCIFYPFRTAF